MTRQTFSLVRSSVLALMLLGSLGAIGCGDDDGPGPDACRFDPARCGGGPGGDCRSNGDCAGGFCCQDEKHCGGGMCTYDCGVDADCPSDMGCEHGVCFFLCHSDADCAVGQKCGHDHTVCEWP